MRIGPTRGLALAATVALAAFLSPRPAAAQDYAFAAVFSVGSGIEGGGRGYAAGVRRAPTQLRIGGEARLPEMPRSILQAGLLINLEPGAAVGGDFRYAHLLGERLSLHAGVEGWIAPSTLFGATAGAELLLPPQRSFQLLLGPSIQAFFFGSDLPDGNVIWQGLFHVGIHVDLK